MRLVVIKYYQNQLNLIILPLLCVHFSHLSAVFLSLIFHELLPDRSKVNLNNGKTLYLESGQN